VKSISSLSSANRQSNKGCTRRKSMKKFSPILVITIVLILSLVTLIMPVAALSTTSNLTQGPALAAAPAMPAVVSISPASKTLGVSCTPKIVVTFDSVVTPAMLEGFALLLLGINTIPIKITCDGKIATIVPVSPLRNAANYEVRVGTARSWFGTYIRWPCLPHLGPDWNKSNRALFLWK